MTKYTAQATLAAIASKDYDALRKLGIRVYGNKGRMWTNTACITNLDPVKGECNPRLASNSCGVEEIGCPKCLAALTAIASPATARKYYAMEWGMGRAACATTGNRYGVSYRAFPSSAERDAWCEDGGDFTTSAGWREAVRASDPELRRTLEWYRTHSLDLTCLH